VLRCRLQAHSQIIFKNVGFVPHSSFYIRPCCDEYEEVLLDDYRCRCGLVRKCAAGTPFTNLMQHIQREHPAVEHMLLTATPGDMGSVVHYVRHTAQNVFS
jgi:hypothetical protein